MPVLPPDLSPPELALISYWGSQGCNGSIGMWVDPRCSRVTGECDSHLMSNLLLPNAPGEFT